MTILESAADAIARPAVGFTRSQALAMRLWAPFMIMGFIIVVSSFVIGIINGMVAADYFEFSRVEREAAVAGSDLVEKKVFIESVSAWLPEFRFLGIGLILAGITLLFTTILGALRISGATVQQSLGVTIVLPRAPIIARVFPILLITGLALLLAALALGIVQALMTASYWDHSIALELNPAPRGSDLLSDLGTIEAMDRWLEPFKFVGTALILSAIGLSAASTVWVLRFQSRRLLDILSGRP